MEFVGIRSSSEALRLAFCTGCSTVARFPRTLFRDERPGRWGNRQLKVALLPSALAPIRMHSDSKAYCGMKRGLGKLHSTIRRLDRRMLNASYTILRNGDFPEADGSNKGLASTLEPPQKTGD